MTEAILSKQDHLTAIENRRSHYAISNEQVISDERLQQIVTHAVKHTPSSFNSQSGRVVVLLGEQHSKLWEITTETLRKIVPADNFDATQQKMNGFAAGYGTILFFEDQAVIENLQEQFSLYKDNFPIWSLQSSGMLQHVIWTALDSEGYGASLQHYNPLIDDEVKQQWNLSNSWKLLAQMPFGKKLTTPGEKQFQPIEERLKIIK
ncbi:nitroreductase family protein [Paenibacillus yanchengensis]|uniref:Nitroreductase family protein n=1 Tax=Paenibacillus yanchengensis TaxID=2035833 RepID=A0ABW4YGK6_9BACL